MGLDVNLKIKPETGGQRAMTWQVRREVERVQLIVLVGDIQQRQTRFNVALIKAPSDESIELPKIISGKIWCVSAIGLLRPERLRSAKEARGMIEQREQIHLV